MQLELDVQELKRILQKSLNVVSETKQQITEVEADISKLEQEKAQNDIMGRETNETTLQGKYKELQALQKKLQNVDVSDRERAEILSRDTEFRELAEKILKASVETIEERQAEAREKTKELYELRAKYLDKYREILELEIKTRYNSGICETVKRYIPEKRNHCFGGVDTTEIFNELTKAGTVLINAQEILEILRAV